jgi:hypothetical protein
MRVEREGASGVARCDCLKTGRGARLMDDAKIPPRYAGCELGDFTTDDLPKSLDVA